MEPSESQQYMVSIHRNLTKTANVEYENPFISQSIEILIKYTMNKSLDHVSCTDCILDPALPDHEPTTTNNCNLIFGRRFIILLKNKNEATFYALRKYELMHLYSTVIKPGSLETNDQHSITILDNLLPFRFPWCMWGNFTKYLLEK